VREALVERERLLRIAPHIIWPMSFVLPHVETLRPRWMIRLGLFVYDHIGARKKLAASKSVHFTRNQLVGAPLKSHLKHGFIYSDCWVQDSRLVILNAIDAAERGATLLPRWQFISATQVETKDGHRWQAQCKPASGKPQTIHARAIVNAAGSWVGDVIKNRLNTQSSKRVRLIKGSHIVVPRLYEGEHAYFLQNPDGRIEFVIPYEHNFSLIGTTDITFNADPRQLSISAEETAYLCDSVNRYFNKQITPDDVVWSYSGVRPLHDDNAGSSSAVTRDYELELTGDNHHPALLSVFGGKITTYRKLAEHALEKLQPLIGGDPQSWTATKALPGGDFRKGDFDQFLTTVRERWPFLSEKLATRLARAYGTRISHLLGNAQSHADLGQDFGGGLTQVEIDYLVQREWARTAQDILWRRSKLGLHTSKETESQLTSYLHKQGIDIDYQRA
jgi:glycerol-3-phosphate dehydrogenase